MFKVLPSPLPGSKTASYDSQLTPTGPFRELNLGVGGVFTALSINWMRWPAGERYFVLNRSILGLLGGGESGKFSFLSSNTFRLDWPFFILALMSAWRSTLLRFFTVFGDAVGMSGGGDIGASSGVFTGEISSDIAGTFDPVSVETVHGGVTGSLATVLGEPSSEDESTAVGPGGGGATFEHDDEMGVGRGK